MIKRLISLALALMLTLAIVPASISPAAAAADTFIPVTGWDMMKKLGAGITFANTTEARQWPWATGEKPKNTEIVWGQPIIEQWHLQAVALKGFDSYRICVSWTPHMDENYIIDPAWMDRIQEIVDWALEAGLNVVMNTHHEEELYWLIRDGEYDAAKKHLNAIWSQVAEHFKGYSEKLVFEIMNEPNLLEHYQGDGEWITENGQISRKLCETVSKLNFDALDTIRSSGGHNDKRVVMLCLPGAQALTLPYMEEPDDPYAVFGAFGYDGAFFSKEIASVIQKTLDKGIGFINKEDDMTENAKKHYKEIADMGIPSFWFTGCASYGEVKDSFNRITGEWVNTHLVEDYFAAYGKTPGPDFKDIPAPVFPHELEGPFSDKKYDQWMPPRKVLTAAKKMVVEHAGEISWFKFSLSDPFTEYEIGHERITQEPGKIIFDLRGLEGNTLGFLTWNDGDAAKIKRIYLLASEAPNLDTALAWAREGIQSAFDKGFIPTDIQSNYTKVITRGEFCRMAVKYIEYATGKSIDAVLTEQGKTRDPNAFSDTHDPDILAAYALGVTSGVGGGKFNPNGQFNRQQAAVMLRNVCKVLGRDVSPAPEADFTDLNSADGWAVAGVNYCRANKIMNGSGGLFKPMDFFTRQESIVTFNNMK